eukprot:TRINITY_DN2202_c0_g1_i12.p1 TRINITY_DN2202_c0_g1~~TRINITY_DN2202_c0_g1_i12.p1  ORF type:complete len:320 (+),score=39.09 TRINITY_DN2202_c0_g1_i12:373-1332(+)
MRGNVKHTKPRGSKSPERSDLRVKSLNYSYDRPWLQNVKKSEKKLTIGSSKTHLMTMESPSSRREDENMYLPPLKKQRPQRFERVVLDEGEDWLKGDAPSGDEFQFITGVGIRENTILSGINENPSFSVSGIKDPLSKTVPANNRSTHAKKKLFETMPLKPYEKVKNLDQKKFLGALSKTLASDQKYLTRKKVDTGRSVSRQPEPTRFPTLKRVKSEPARLVHFEQNIEKVKRRKPKLYISAKANSLGKIKTAQSEIEHLYRVYTKENTKYVTTNKLRPSFPARQDPIVASATVYLRDYSPALLPGVLRLPNRKPRPKK